MAKKTILIACVSGLSSSLLISKLAHVAEQKEKDYQFITSPASQIKANIQTINPAVVLLAPQIQYLKDEILKITDSVQIPLTVVSIQDYAMMNSNKILATVDELVNILEAKKNDKRSS